MGRIIKWIVIGVVALAVIGFIAGPEEFTEGVRKGADAAGDSTPDPTPEAFIVDDTPAPEPTEYVMTAEDERVIFELAIDMTIADMDKAEICGAIDMLGMDIALSQMHEGYGSGYWDAGYVESALRQACP